jgi:hypothetical protein
MEVTVLVNAEEQHEKRVTIFRTPAEILIRLPQTQVKYVRHYFVGMFNATILKCRYDVWSHRLQRTKTGIYSLQPSYLSKLKYVEPQNTCKC